MAGLLMLYFYFNFLSLFTLMFHTLAYYHVFTHTTTTATTTITPKTAPTIWGQVNRTRPDTTHLFRRLQMAHGLKWFQSCHYRHVLSTRLKSLHLLWEGGHVRIPKYPSRHISSSYGYKYLLILIPTDLIRTTHSLASMWISLYHYSNINDTCKIPLTILPWAGWRF